MYKSNLKKLKDYLNLTSLELAEKLGISYSTLGSYERGNRTPSIDFPLLLIEKLNININWLLTGTGDMFISTCENTLQEQNNSNLVKNLDTFYKRFNKLQKENNLNDYQMSKKTGITETRIEKLGIGKAVPSLDELSALKSNFDVSIDWLLYGETPIEQNNDTNLSLEEIRILKKLTRKINL